MRRAEQRRRRLTINRTNNNEKRNANNKSKRGTIGRRLSIFGFNSKEARDRRQRDANSTTLMLIVVIAVFLAVELPLSTMTALHTISSKYELHHTLLGKVKNMYFLKISHWNATLFASFWLWILNLTLRPSDVSEVYWCWLLNVNFVCQLSLQLFVSSFTQSWNYILMSLLSQLTLWMNQIFFIFEQETNLYVS